MQPLSIFSLFTIWLVLSSSEIIIHKFSLGRIKGKTSLSRNGTKFYTFLGIPYAKPPIGEMRFQNPNTDIEPWYHLYDATKEAEPCAQGGAGGAEFKGDEDCLYLNLYTPKLPNDTSTKLPVWFFLFPGRHLFGDANIAHYGPHYIMDHPVIFISASYRLGPFGFLSTEDDIIPGNFGLKDQSAVLRWINKYVSEFGGDPNKVTISGESSSSQDVCLHMTSPLSRDLFHRGISQSGHCLNYRAVSPSGTARMQAWKLARILGCTSSYIKASEDLLECINSYSTIEISSSLYYMMHDYILPHTYFGIVIENSDQEGAFLTTHPVNEITKPTNKTWLLGINTEEGQQKALGIFAFPSQNKKIRERVINHFEQNMNTLIPYLFGFDYAENSETILEAVKKRYFNEKPFKESFHGFSKAFGLSSIQTGMFEMTLKFPGTKYFYHYDHLNNPGYQKMYIVRFKFQTKEKLENNTLIIWITSVTGVVHGEELRSVMYQPVLFPPTLEGNDRIVSEQVVELWANFVIYGDPNGKRKKQIWKPVTSPNLEYLYIGNLTLTMKSQPLWDDYHFWKKLKMPQLMTTERIQKSTSARLWKNIT